MPKISVIVPTYNRSDLLENAIRSVVDQTYKEWELIIIDDGSTDDTKQIALAWVKEDNRIRYFYEDNSGQAAARNRGITAATGEYIAFLDSDDVYLPDNLEKKIAILEQQKNVLIVNGFSWMVDYKKKKFLGYASYAPSNWLVRREFLEAGQGFSTAQRNIEDMGIRLRAMNAIGRMDIEWFMKEPLTIYFLHENQVSRAANKDPEKFAKRVETLMEDLTVKNQEIYKKFAPYIFSRLANFYCLSGEMNKGRAFFKKSLKAKIDIFTLTIFPVAYLGKLPYQIWEGLLRTIQRRWLWNMQFIFARRNYGKSFRSAIEMLDRTK